MLASCHLLGLEGGGHGAGVLVELGPGDGVGLARPDEGDLPAPLGGGLHPSGDRGRRARARWFRPHEGSDPGRGHPVTSRPGRGQTTTLTSLGGRATTFFGAAPSSSCCTRGEASARRSASASLMPALTSRRSRTLPLTWTTSVTVSSRTS